MSYGQIKYDKDKKPYIQLECKRLHPVTKEKFYRSKKVYLDESLTPAKLRKSADEIDKEFIKECEREMSLGLDVTAITYKDFAEIYLKYLKENMAINTYHRNKEVSGYVIGVLGHYKLRDLKPDILDMFVDKVNNMKSTKEIILPTKDFNFILKERGFTYTILRRQMGVQHETLRRAMNGGNVSKLWADKFSYTINEPFDKLFTYEKVEYELAYSTKKKYVSFLKASLSYAVKKRYIERNYATSEYVESVKNKEGNKEKETMTKDEFERFYNFVLDYPNIRIKTAMLIFLNTGVRKEELVGLTWENINFEESKLSIENTVIYVPSEGTVFSNRTKNASSRRTIYISKELVDVLKEYKEYCDEQRIKSSHLFIQENGNIIHPNTINFWLDKVLKEASIKHYTVHSLRHLYATYILDIGDEETLVAVSKRLGHSRVSTTADIYSHVFSEKDKKIANIMVDEKSEKKEIELLKEKLENILNCVEEMKEFNLISDAVYKKFVQIINED